MGYESKFIVVIDNEYGVYSDIDGKTLKFAETVCEYNYCKSEHGSAVYRLFSEAPDTDKYIYLSGDGDNRVTQDRYGEPLTEIELEDLVQALQEDFDDDINTYGYPFRRISPLSNLLKSFITNKDVWGDLKVLHYGY